MNKTCRKCGKTKPLTEFHRNGSYAYNNEARYRSWCKECYNTHRKNRGGNSTPEMRKARWKAREASTKGELERRSCEACGNVNVHAHHDDYTKPLKVRLLCVLHHTRWHLNKEKACWLCREKAKQLSGKGLCHRCYERERYRASVGKANYFYDA